MRSIVVLVFCMVAAGFPAGCFSQDTLRILFIGNSFMQYNDLPGLFLSLAEGAGEPALAASHTPGGASVGDTIQGSFAHMNNPYVYELIRGNDWDYLFLQDRQSRFAMGYGTFPGDSRVIEGHIKILDSLLFHHPCARMLWFAGFGPKAGYPPLAWSGEALIDSIYRNYLYLSDTAGQVIVPIGPSFLRIMEGYPAVNLWGPDGEHPSLAGSWLIASALYATVFKGSPLTSTASPGLPWPVDSLLRVTAYQAVMDSMDHTGLLSITPVITRSGNLLTVEGYDSCRWYLGNTPWPGSGCTAVMTVNGTYRAVVTDSAGCTRRTLPVEYIGGVGIPGTPAEPVGFRLSPNPAGRWLEVESDGDVTDLVIKDLTGRTVFRAEKLRGALRICPEEWPAGMYLVTGSAHGRPVRATKFVKL